MRVSLACTFTGHPLDRADARRRDPDWIVERLSDSSSRFLGLVRGKPLLRVRPDLGAHWLDAADAASAIEAGADVVFLGMGDGIAHFAIALDRAPDCDDLKVIDLRSAAMQLATRGEAHRDVATLGLARSLLDWHHNHRFCSKCGAASALTKGGFARRCSDTTCGAEHFPRVDPVVIMLAVDGDRCVLGRQPRFAPSVYSALAGFVEPGESLEEAVRREIEEEAGIVVEEVRYVASQPWPFPSTLMLGFIAQARTFDLSMDEHELEDVRWFSKDEIRDALAGKGRGLLVPPAMAIAHQLMRRWVDGV